MKFIGIDIAKGTFVAVYPQLTGYKIQSYTNDLKDVEKFISSIKKLEHHYSYRRWQ